MLGFKGGVSTIQVCTRYGEGVKANLQNGITGQDSRGQEWGYCEKIDLNSSTVSWGEISPPLKIPGWDPASTETPLTQQSCSSCSLAIATSHGLKRVIQAAPMCWQKEVMTIFHPGGHETRINCGFEIYINYPKIIGLASP